MAKVFISYRRTDSAPYTGRIYDRLVAKFGRKNVFKDVDDIPPGVNFATYIQDSLRQCGVELVVIGRDWLDSRDANGNRRLDDAYDFVRIEIETALRLGLTIIPILLEGTSMPPAAQLPESLRPLALINGIVVRNDPDFSRDMERVIMAVEHAPSARPASESPRWRASRPRPATASGESSVNQASPVQAPARTAVKERPAIPMKRVAPGFDRVVAGGLRPLGAAIAALLVITSFGVLLSQHGLPLLGGAQATKTTTTHAPTATSTPGLLTLPYSAKAPGPRGVAGCDPGAANWQPNANSSNYLLMTCPATPQPHLQMKNTALTGTALADEQFIVTSSPAGGSTVPSTYTVSVQMSNLSSGSTGFFQILGSSTGAFGGAAGVRAWYTVEVTSTGGYSMSAYPVDLSDCSKDGVIDMSAPVELALAIGASSVTLKVDGSAVKTCSDTAMAGYKYRLIELGVQGGGSTVDYANFSIAP